MKIFVLDDSPLRLDAFCRHFSAQNEVRVAQTALEAIELLESEYFDLIFLDHDLGGKPPEYYGQNCDPSHPNTGSEVIRWMERNPASRRVIIHSRNSVLVPSLIAQLQAIPGTICESIPFDQLAQSWNIKEQIW